MEGGSQNLGCLSVMSADHRPENPRSPHSQDPEALTTLSTSPSSERSRNEGNPKAEMQTQEKGLFLRRS